jgi:hypothetical protein
LLAVATKPESGLITQAKTTLVWPVRVARSSPVASSQILQALSSLAVTTKSESGLIAQA